MEKINVNGEALGNALKLAANLSDVVKMKPNVEPDNSNNANTQQNPNQTVQIKIGDSEKPKTVGNRCYIPAKVVRKQPETHIHKDFPDNRALTEAECNLALEKAKMENALKIQQMEYRKFMDEICRKDRLAKEEQERKDREERRKKNEKKAKVKAIIGGIFAVLGAGALGYAIWSDSKKGSCNCGTPKLTITATPMNPIHAEGDVE